MTAVIDDDVNPVENDCRKTDSIARRKRRGRFLVRVMIATLRNVEPRTALLVSLIDSCLRATHLWSAYCACRA